MKTQKVWNRVCPHLDFIHYVALDKSSFVEPHLQNLAMQQSVRLAIFINDLHTKQTLNEDTP